MNKYLEKVAELEKEALNALKARAMAHEAGVVVDPDTQWKWALRQFRRGPEGKVAQGRDRAQILNRIMGNPAAGNNNFRQAIQSEQRKLTPSDEVQLSRWTDPKIKPRVISRQLASEQMPSGEYIGRYGDKDKVHGLHNTYTPLDSVERIRNAVHYTVRGVVPGEGGTAFKNMAVKGSASRGTRERIDIPIDNARLNGGFDTHVHPSRNHRVRRAEDLSYVPDKYKTSEGGYVDRWFRSRGGQHRSTSPSGKWTKGGRDRIGIFGTADLGVYQSQGHIGTPHNIISSPTSIGQVFLGSHRVVPTPHRIGEVVLEMKDTKKVRQAYLDLTPRKARAENPYLDKLHEMGKTL